MKKRIYNAINVDGMKFTSIQSAAKYCKISPAGLYFAFSKKQKSVKNYSIQYSNNSYFLTKHSLDFHFEQAKAVKVKCLETGKIYPTISKIADELGVNKWTMSVKMEETGKFIDKNGNSYIRLSPMAKRSKRTYGITTSSITRDVHRISNNIDKNKNINTNLNSVSIQNTIIQNLIKSAALLTDTKNYAQAAQILNILHDFDK